MKSQQLGSPLGREKLFEHPSNPHIVIKRMRPVGGMELSPFQLDIWNTELERLESFGIRLAESFTYYNTKDKAIYQFLARIPTPVKFLDSNLSDHYRRLLQTGANMGSLSAAAPSIIDTYIGIYNYLKSKLSLGGYMLRDIDFMMQYVIHPETNELLLVDQEPYFYDTTRYPYEIGKTMEYFLEEWESMIGLCARLVGATQAVKNIRAEILQCTSQQRLQFRHEYNTTSPWADFT